MTRWIRRSARLPQALAILALGLIVPFASGCISATLAGAGFIASVYYGAIVFLPLRAVAGTIIREIVVSN